MHLAALAGPADTRERDNGRRRVRPCSVTRGRKCASRARSVRPVRPREIGDSRINDPWLIRGTTERETDVPSSRVVVASRAIVERWEADVRSIDQFRNHRERGRRERGRERVTITVFFFKVTAITYVFLPFSNTPTHIPYEMRPSNIFFQAATRERTQAS